MSNSARNGKKITVGDGGFAAVSSQLHIVHNQIIPMNLIIPKENLGTLFWRLLL